MLWMRIVFRALVSLCWARIAVELAGSLYYQFVPDPILLICACVACLARCGKNGEAAILLWRRRGLWKRIDRINQILSRFPR